MSDEPSSIWRSSNNWRQNPASPSGTPASGNSSAWRTPGSRGNNNNSGSRGGWGSSRGAGGDGQQQQSSVDAAVAEGRRIYVGNLPYAAKHDDVEDMLKQQGFAAYEKIHISVDALSGRNPGYCFIEFADRATAERALEALAGADLLDRQIKVGPCQPRRTGQQQQQQQGRNEEGAGGWGANRGYREGGGEQRRERGWGGGGGGDWSGDRRDGAGRRDGIYDSPRQVDAVVEEKRRLYVGGLPKMETQEECEQQMTALFNGFAIETISKPIAPHPSAQAKPGNHYYCFVDFATADDASSALAALDGQAYQDGNLRIGIAKGERPRERRNFDGWNSSRNGEGQVAAE